MSEIENASDSFRGLQPIATSWYGMGGDSSLVQSLHMQWDSVLAATITIWASNFPDQTTAQVAGVLLSSVSAGDWIQLNPPTGYTAISPAGAATIAAGPMVIVVPAGVAGGIFVDLGNTGAKRLRVQVVCTVAGQLRIRPHGKH